MAGQFGDYRSFGYRSLAPEYDFSGVPAFGAADFSGSAVVRDSRQDRGTGNYNSPVDVPNPSTPTLDGAGKGRPSSARSPSL